MMTKTKAQKRLETLRNEPKTVDRLIGWLGGRVMVELDHIVGRSLSYFPMLADLFEKEKERRLWAFILAADELHTRLPKNSQFLAKRQEERENKNARSPFRGWTTARRIASDFEKAKGLLDDGFSYEQAANELARLNPRKYYHHKPKADNLRKVMSRLGYKKKPVSM